MAREHKGTHEIIAGAGCIRGGHLVPGMFQHPILVDSDGSCFAEGRDDDLSGKPAAGARRIVIAHGQYRIVAAGHLDLAIRAEKGSADSHGRGMIAAMRKTVQFTLIGASVLMLAMIGAAAYLYQAGQDSSAPPLVGPAPTAAIAVARGWKTLVTPGIMCGIPGYAIGTCIGVAVAKLLM